MCREETGVNATNAEKLDMLNIFILESLFINDLLFSLSNGYHIFFANYLNYDYIIDNLINLHEYAYTFLDLIEDIVPCSYTFFEKSNICDYIIQKICILMNIQRPVRELSNVNGTLQSNSMISSPNILSENHKDVDQFIYDD